MLWFEEHLFLSGPQVSPRERVPQPGRLLCGVRLQPGTAYLLTHQPLYLLAGKRARLVRLLRDDRSVAQLEKQLAAAGSDERFHFLETFLSERLAGKTIDQRVIRALRCIENSAGQLRISQLAVQCRTSPRHLSRLIRCWVGLSPKHLARIMRFQALLRNMKAPNGVSTATMAAELGYFDQSHLSGESARLSGVPPGPLSKRHMADFSKTRCL